MKVAFVGKGGSGKSTMSALFIRYLMDIKNADVLAIDADINMNLPDLLGMDFDADKHMARPDVASALRNHMRGENPRIADENAFLPSTTPGAGSNVIARANDAALSPYAAPIPGADNSRLMVVGSYDAEGIGQTCYHGHLFVAENLLAHTYLGDDNWAVCDMVAGTDAFAYSMHLQFDAIFLICEPTPESVAVCKLYDTLATEAGVRDIIHIIANKVEDEDDIAYITEQTGHAPIAQVPALRSLKKSRQRGEAAKLADLPDAENLFAPLIAAAKNTKLGDDARLKLLHQMHRRLNEKDWVKQSYGDVLDQIDPNYTIPRVA